MSYDENSEVFAFALSAFLVSGIGASISVFLLVSLLFFSIMSLVRRERGLCIICTGEWGLGRKYQGMREERQVLNPRGERGGEMYRSFWGMNLQYWLLDFLTLTCDIRVWG